MADKPVGEVVAVDAVLDALSSPTSSDVYEALLPYGNDAVAAVAAKRAAAGGGGSLPEGWDQTGDPANVDSNGGNLDLGTGDLSADVANVTQVLLVDDPGGEDLTLRSLEVDPSAGGGFAANAGSLVLQTNGQLWTKTGAAHTDWTAVGGAGNFQVADYTFTEVATAGTYTATQVLPARAFVVAAGFWLEANWAADTADITIGDADNTWVSTGAGAGTNFSWNDVNEAYNGPRASVGPTFAQGASVATSTVTMTIVTTIGSPPVVPTGLIRVRIIYCTAPSPTAATFA